jgi:hypothetical protein
MFNVQLEQSMQKKDKKLIFLNVAVNVRTKNLLVPVYKVELADHDLDVRLCGRLEQLLKKTTFGNSSR